MTVIFAQMSSYSNSLQVDAYKPSVTDFARESLALLGCLPGQAEIQQGRASLGVWLHCKPVAEARKCIKAMKAKSSARQTSSPGAG